VGFRDSFRFRRKEAPNPAGLHCRFCGKSGAHAEKMIAGTPPFFICEACACRRRENPHLRRMPAVVSGHPSGGTRTGPFALTLSSFAARHVMSAFSRWLAPHPPYRRNWSTTNAPEQPRPTTEFTVQDAIAIIARRDAASDGRSRGVPLPPGAQLRMRVRASLVQWRSGEVA